METRKRKRIRDSKKEIKPKKSDTNEIPIEIVESILPQLPAQKLWKLRSVSDHMNSLVRNPSFIESHFNHSKNTTGRLNFIIGDVREGDLEDNLNFSVSKDLDLSVDVQFHSMKIYGSCNGLLLIGTGLPCRKGEKLWMFNPCIGQSKKLPKAPCGKIKDEEEKVSYGLGLLGGVLKVVRIRSALFTDIHSIPHEVSVYSLDSNKWRKLIPVETGIRFTEKALNVQGCIDSEAGVLVGEALHWVGIDPRHGGDEDNEADEDECLPDEVINANSCAIVAFDLNGEKFKCIQLPEIYLMEMKVACVRGNLSLVTYSEAYCNVWMMENYGESKPWVKLFHINTQFLRDPLTFRPLLLSEKWCLAYDGNVCLVNVKRKSVKTLNELHDNHRDLRAVVYTDSLIPLRRQRQRK